MTSTGSVAVHWKVHNSARVPLQLFWVSFDGLEQRMEKIGPGDHSTIETYQGHAWRLRSPQGILVAEVHSSSEPFKVAPCEQIYGSDAIVLPSNLAHGIVASEQDLRHRWQGAALQEALLRCDPWRFLSHEEPFIGFHVLCMLRKEEDDEPDALALFGEGQWSEGYAPAAPCCLPPLVCHVCTLFSPVVHLCR